MMPTMKKMFSKYYEEMEQKTEKRNWRNERKAKVLQDLEKKKIADAFTK